MMQSFILTDLEKRAVRVHYDADALACYVSKRTEEAIEVTVEVRPSQVVAAIDREIDRLRAARKRLMAGSSG